MVVTIVIPTKNAGTLFEDVLKKIFSQKTQYSFEVICIDSGSTDMTLDIIKKYNAKLFCIKPEEFGHGKTRNYGASLGTGKYIIFITQDALPTNDSWIENFINAMEMDDEIVGGFGIHYPYPDCNLLDKRDIEQHFKGFGLDNTIYRLEDQERYDREEGYRHLLAFFSDNNSCLRRDIWEKYPYDDVDFAEDQIWARKMIELGYKKIYCPNAAVFHSHNYKVLSYFGRYFDEYKSLYKLHNYLIVKESYKLIPSMMRHIIYDIKYLRSLNLSKNKLKCYLYAICRDSARYIAGYLGGRYIFCPKYMQKILDRLISQQYKQMRG